MIIPKIKFSFFFEDDVKTSDLTKITSSQTIFDNLSAFYNMETLLYRETFIVIFLNRSNGVIGYTELSHGGIGGTVVDVRHLFGAALKLCASSIIISHNHPSGNLKPSKSDIHLTNKIKEAGKLLDIQLLDHVIVTDSGYYSFADESEL